jgi:hypothetical protein
MSENIETAGTSEQDDVGTRPAYAVGSDDAVVIEGRVGYTREDPARSGDTPYAAPVRLGYAISGGARP